MGKFNDLQHFLPNMLFSIISIILTHAAMQGFCPRGICLHTNPPSVLLPPSAVYRITPCTLCNDVGCICFRLHMLGKSSDKLPYNIVYVLDEDNGSSCDVIGHSRLCKVHGHNKSCFIESGKHVVLLFMYLWTTVQCILNLH